MLAVACFIQNGYKNKSLVSEKSKVKKKKAKLEEKEEKAVQFGTTKIINWSGADFTKVEF